jgi:hypothetical protein
VCVCILRCCGLLAMIASSYELADALPSGGGSSGRGGSGLRTLLTLGSCVCAVAAMLAGAQSLFGAFKLCYSTNLLEAPTNDA